MVNTVDYFNQSPAKSIATVDPKGNPNICLCGSATMINEETIYALYGYFHKSYSNLQSNPNCVFLSSKGLSKEYWQHFEKTGEKLYPPGYRYFCKFTEESSDSSKIVELKTLIQKDVGARVANRLNKLLVFRVVEIKELRF